MNVYSSVSKLIFAGMTTFALSSVAMAGSDDAAVLDASTEETTGISDLSQDQIQNSRSGQEGMAGKTSANHEELNKGMDHDDMSDDMGMEDHDMQDMEDDAPISTTDQEGMAGKDSANHEEMEEGM